MENARETEVTSGSVAVEKGCKSPHLSRRKARYKTTRYYRATCDVYVNAQDDIQQGEREREMTRASIRAVRRVMGQGVSIGQNVPGKHDKLFFFFARPFIGRVTRARVCMCASSLASLQGSSFLESFLPFFPPRRRSATRNFVASRVLRHAS